MFGLETIEKYVEDKICDYGANAIMGFVGATPAGAALAAMNRFSEFIDTGGMSEVDALASAQIRPLIFKAKGFSLLRKMQDALTHPTHLTVWQRSGWATSREDWLSNKWQHDWRSQPRNPAGGAKYWSGTWMPGRLPYPAIGATAIGKGKARTSRQRRRIARYRRYGRAAARSIKWGS